MLKFETVLFALAFLFLALISFPRNEKAPENPNPPRLQAGSPFPAGDIDDVDLGETPEPHLVPVNDNPVVIETIVEDEKKDEDDR